MSDANPNAGRYAGDPDAEALAALDRIDEALGGARGAEAAIDPKEACEIYRRLRPWIGTVLPIIRRIPVIGPKVARLIEALMSIADHCCKPA